MSVREARNDCRPLGRSGSKCCSAITAPGNASEHGAAHGLTIHGMAETCAHLDTVRDVVPSADGCEDCLAIGSRWVHLRLCMACGHVGCCDSSPHRHATAHWRAHPDHPLIRSFEPGENWWWCYQDELLFDVEGAPPAPSHP